MLTLPKTKAERKNKNGNYAQGIIHHDNSQMVFWGSRDLQI